MTFLLKHSRVAVFFILAALLLSYYLIDPAQPQSPFPACPLRKYTGILCPGCGSQRAIHQLLHGNITAAMGYNAAMVLSIPYLVCGYIFQAPCIAEKYPRMRKALFGPGAILVILVLITAFTLGRNYSHFISTIPS